MHLPDGFLSPAVAASSIAITVGYGIVAHYKIKSKLETEELNTALIACTTAFIFAAQMFNFPVLGGTSGHFLGGTFATLLFGPYVSFFILAIVLFTQALFFGDGGVLALGSNILIMGVGAPQTAMITIQMLKSFKINVRIKNFIAALLSVIMASAVCSVLLALSNTAPLSIALPVMVFVHTLIGIGEGLITATALEFLSKSKLTILERQNV